MWWVYSRGALLGARPNPGRRAGTGVSRAPLPAGGRAGHGEWAAGCARLLSTAAAVTGSSSAGASGCSGRRGRKPRCRAALSAKAAHSAQLGQDTLLGHEANLAIGHLHICTMSWSESRGRARRVGREVRGPRAAAAPPSTPLALPTRVRSLPNPAPCAAGSACSPGLSGHAPELLCVLPTSTSCPPPCCSTPAASQPGGPKKRARQAGVGRAPELLYLLNRTLSPTATPMSQSSPTASTAGGRREPRRQCASAASRGGTQQAGGWQQVRRDTLPPPERAAAGQFRSLRSMPRASPRKGEQGAHPCR